MPQIHFIWFDAGPRSRPRNLMDWRERQPAIGVAVLLTKALMTYDSNLREERDTYSGWYAYLVPFYNLLRRNSRGTLPNQGNWIGREFLGEVLYYVIIFRNVTYALSHLLRISDRVEGKLAWLEYRERIARIYSTRHYSRPFNNKQCLTNNTTPRRTIFWMPRLI